MFDKVLVANRGEIAIRIMRACRDLEVKSVAVYSDADKASLYTNYADEKYPLGNPSPQQSYLNIEKIIDIAVDSKADAIHPGYGFLAENPEFGKECEKNGITLIGPSGDVINKMGDKITSKQIMKKAGVPVIEGTEKGVSDIDTATKIAEDIGYPVIVKASAGGGGIGMRTVYEEDELIRAIESTQSVAKTNFGDSTVFIEKYLEKPRHIEFQVLADEEGNVIHLADRECSIQRRHQKLLEEAPSPIMTDELREEMGESTVKAAEYIGYTSAGTIEYLYDNGNYYFLEMNTRVQVEHPITEMVTNVDIVKEQIKVASGKELSYSQNDITVKGHAIECRINAEDPFVTYGNNRNEAILRMKRALGEYIVLGVKTTIPFHKAIIRNPNFLSGDLNTHFIDDNKNKIYEEMEVVIEEDLEYVNRLKSTFMPAKKIAAISTAVGSYLNEAKKKQPK